MKYKEIVELNDCFISAYDLENETESYWKQFIPNEKFYEVLSKVINSLESSRPEERKSIWLQGTYGTGKSHATAVIKHLLSDDLNEVSDFIRALEDKQVKFRMERFRENKRVFPVVLKGASFITDNRSFALVVEKAVKNALRKENVEITTRTDFENVIARLQSDDINWENVFAGTRLEARGSIEDISLRLQQGDITIIREIENALSQRNIHLSIRDIVEWLIDIRNELKVKAIADYLVIYWDEFTQILELPESGLLLTELQRIAELSANEGIYLFIITHKKPHQTRITEDDVKKVRDRFKVIDYAMNPITAYHIIGASIKKKDKNKFTEIRDRYIDPVRPLIERIAEGEGIQVQRSLENLFPIHPYTAYLATFLARQIGSTERSIFKFLNDDNRVCSFRKFIEENPEVGGKIFLTTDYLWDFFYEDFESINDNGVRTILERFKLHRDNLLRNKNEKYLSVFKSVLLLNLLNKYVFTKDIESLFIIPSKENIMDVFAGVIAPEEMDNILSFMDKEQMIDRTPDNLYLVMSSALPPEEIATKKDTIKHDYDTIEKILSREQEEELRKAIISGISTSMRREVELMIADANLNAYLLRNKVERYFKRDYTIHLCLFLEKSEKNLQEIKNISKELSNDFENIIFVVSDVVLDSDTFSKFIEYKARALVAAEHNYMEEQHTGENYAKGIIDNWLNQVKTGYIEWFLRGESGKEILNRFGEKINENLSLIIFSYGLENIEKTRRNVNIWSSRYAEKSIETFLFVNNREEALERTSSGLNQYLQGIIMDNNGGYIVDPNLKIEDSVSESHPLKRMYLQIKDIFARKQNSGVFNLGDTLKFLTKPPYGLYPNMVNMAAMGFLMREYVGKLFESGTGTPIQKEAMREKILILFKYWGGKESRGKLNVRFGTESEERLIEILVDLFDLESTRSLNNVRWEIRGWIKNQGFPIWMLRFIEGVNEATAEAIDSIFSLVQSVDSEITSDEIESYLRNIEGVERELSRLIKITPKDYKELFRKWIESAKETDTLPEVSFENIDDIIAYIKENMQEEVASWTEDKVKEEVKNWYITRISAKVTTGTSVAGSSINDIGVEDNVSEVEDIDSIKNLIYESPEQRVKDTLFKLVAKLKSVYPSILEEVRKHLEEFN